jgi:hypothetical protein
MDRPLRPLRTTNAELENYSGRFFPAVCRVIDHIGRAAGGSKFLFLGDPSFAPFYLAYPTIYFDFWMQRGDCKGRTARDTPAARPGH